MIRPRYAITLARTKLRSKRGMLWASVVVSSLLFATLVAAVCVFQGAQKTAVRFVEAANNGQYLVMTMPTIPGYVNNFYSNGMVFSAEQIKQFRADEKTYYDTERARYKAAGVPYDESSEIPLLKPSILVDPNVPEDRRFMIDWSSPVADYLMTQRFDEYAKTATNKFSDLKKLATQYGATHFYTQRSSGLGILPAQRLIRDGKENLAEEFAHEAMLQTADTQAIYNGSYSFVDDELLVRALNTTPPSPLKGIPVVPSAQEVVKLFGDQLGVSKEPAADQTRAQWLAQVQQKANGFTYQTCYRNAAEQQLLQKIQLDYTSIKDHENDKTYIKPSLLYNLPKEACGDMTIASDTRTTAEKDADATMESYQKKLGDYEAPAHRVLTYQIVGLAYAEPYGSAPKTVNEYVKSLLIGSPDDLRGSTAPIPSRLYDTLPKELKFDELITSAAGRRSIQNHEEFSTRIVAFNTVDEARRFIATGCPLFTSDCDKPFQTGTYGSNYLLLDDMAAQFTTLLTILLPVVLVLALVIIWFTISRIMADNRKETAVYRAMGAKRADISAIYLTYVGLVTIRIVVLSVVVGLAAAFALDYLYSPIIENLATSSYGTITGAPQVRLFDVSSPLLLVVVAAVVVACFLASIQPLIRNVMRPPVEDMRGE